MKTFTGPYCRQGEVNILACDAIPADAPKAPEHEGRPIVGHSETGHFHVVEGNAVRVYEQDEFTSFIDAEESARVVHLKGFDTHETIELPPGKYRIARQREHTPEGFRRAAD